MRGLLHHEAMQSTQNLHQNQAMADAYRLVKCALLSGHGDASAKLEVHRQLPPSPLPKKSMKRLPLRLQPQT